MAGVDAAVVLTVSVAVTAPVPEIAVGAVAEQVGASTASAGLAVTAQVSVTVPVNPPVGVTVMVEVPYPRRIADGSDQRGLLDGSRGSCRRRFSVIKAASPPEYGISDASPGEHEIDYLIGPGVGGTEDIHNLWPEAYNARPWNARVKDSLEERLHQLVCAGELDLSTAQHDIATDWIAAYKKYFDTERPQEVSKL